MLMGEGEGWDGGDAWWIPIALSTRERSLLSQVRAWSSWHCDIPHKLWIQTGWLIVNLVYSMSLILHGHNLTLLVLLVPVMPKVPSPIRPCTGLMEHFYFVTGIALLFSNSPLSRLYCYMMLINMFAVKRKTKKDLCGFQDPSWIGLSLVDRKMLACNKSLLSKHVPYVI